MEKNRTLGQAKSALVSAITHLQLNTEPLIISQIRHSLISDVLDELNRSGVLTDRHISIGTLTTLNRYMKLEVRHAFGLLKAILSRMKAEDIFGGRIPDGWGSLLSDNMANQTRNMLRSKGAAVVDTLLTIANSITSSETVPEWLLPDKSLLFAISQIEGNAWNGIPAELKMEHLGHVLILAETLTEN